MWNTTVRRVVVAVAAGWAASGASAQPGFRFLPIDPYITTHATAISPDARFAVGTGIGNLGVGNGQWIYELRLNNTGPLGFLPRAFVQVGTTYHTNPQAVGNDGTAFGNALVGLPNGGFPPVCGWFNSPTWGFFQRLPAAPADTFAFAGVSPDGSVIVGNSSGPGAPSQGGRFTIGPSTLSFQPLGLTRAVTAGTTLSGEQYVIGIDGQNNVVRVSLAGNPTTVIAPAPFNVHAVSADGSTIAGTDATGQPMRWRNGTVQPLDAGGLLNLRITGISVDGGTIIGWGDRVAGFGFWNGRVWQPGQPGRDLWEIFPEPFPGARTGGFTRLTGLSADGTTLVGSVGDLNVNSPNHQPRAFTAVLPLWQGDSCTNPTPVSYGTTISSTRNALRNSNLNSNCSIAEGAAPDVIFSFVPLANESVVIDTCGSDFDTTLQVTTAPGGCGGTFVACNDDASPACGSFNASRVSVNVFAGQTYWIRVSGYQGSRGTVRLNITAPNRPVNDTCSTPLEIEPGFSREILATNALTDSFPPRCQGGFTLFQDVWYTTTAPDFGTITVSNCGGGGNQGINIYPIDACQTGAAPIACATAGCPSGGGASAWVNCTPGQRFLIRVGGLFGASPSGLITVRYSCDVPNLDSYFFAVNQDNPVGHWRFNDSGSATAASARVTSTANNWCGDYPGMYWNNPGRSAAGLWGKSLELSGQPNQGVARIWAPAPADNVCGIFGAYTLEAWIRTTSTAPGVIITQRGADQDQSLTLLYSYNPVGPQPVGHVAFVLDGPGVFTGAISTATLNDGRWHHVVGVREFLLFSGGWRYSIYVDGVLQGVNNLVGVGSRAPTAVNGDNWWQIGYHGPWGIGFTGQIDEVATYCAALPPDRIGAHYSIGYRQCNPADVAGIGGTPQPDGFLTGDDFNAFISAFAAGDTTIADITGIGGPPNPRDGLITGDDFNLFIASFAAGCP